MTRRCQYCESAMVAVGFFGQAPVQFCAAHLKEHGHDFDCIDRSGRHPDDEGLNMKIEPKSDYDAWRALMQRCMTELGLTAGEPASDGSVVLRLTGPAQERIAAMCNPRSDLDLVAVVDAHLAARADDR